MNGTECLSLDVPCYALCLSVLFRGIQVVMRCWNDGLHDAPLVMFGWSATGFTSGLEWLDGHGALQDDLLLRHLTQQP